MRRVAVATIACCALGLLASEVYGQVESIPAGTADQACGSPAAPPFCNAVRGDRAEGWLQQSRSEVMAPHGMVVTSQTLAAQAGLQILRQGGNAIDAAVASAAVLSLEEPESVGVASDLFAVIYLAKDHKIYMLNSSGMAPTGATLQHMNQLGYHWNPKNYGPMSGMPTAGILSVTVPGTVWGWQEVLRRFGTMGFKQVLEPARRYAQDGFPVAERVAREWRMPNALPLEHCCTQPDPDSIKTWYINGHAPKAGQIFRNPDLAKTFQLLEDGGTDVFYKGEIARAIIAKSTALGGTMTLEDLANYRGEWVEPAQTSYHGYDIYELPPPAQSWATNEILNILQACVPRWVPGQTLASLGPANPEYWHLMVEAKKLAYADLYHYNADPNFVKVPLAKLLSDSYAQSLCGKVNPQHASSTGPPGDANEAGDTIVLSAADKDGNMVSWVNSNFDFFGSGVTVPGYGFVLHNRGTLFTLDPHSPNVIQPHKRPFNTLSAGFVMHQGVPFMTVTLMGGDMQAQGHAQLLVDVLDLGANLQAGVDMARFVHSQITNSLRLESPLYDRVGAQLAAMGHQVQSVHGAGVGGAQVIQFVPDPEDSASGLHGSYRAGSDFRKDGQAAGW